MSTVHTIRGPISTSRIGRTLAHEHITAGSAGMERLPWVYDPEVAFKCNVEALARAKAVGVDTIIDLTPLDLGRQVELLQRIADADLGIHIVAATGVYRWVPMYLRGIGPDDGAEHFLRELEDGIEGTTLKPGIIKLAWDVEYRLREGRPGLSPREILECMARAVARAAKASGTPISCHTLATDEQGIPLLDIFEDEGLNLRAVTIGHSNDTTNVQYLKEVVRRGATVGLDRFNANHSPAERERRAQLAATLARGGFADQVSLGHDAAPYKCVGRPQSDLDCWLPVPTVEVPLLSKLGVTDGMIDAMFTESVKATFEAAGSMAKR
ncbi:MAG: hypothetical protein WD472_08065 [Dehalococcoidia bacterium]